MTEILFILTTIFVAYVIYSIVNEQKASISSIRSGPSVPMVTEEAKLDVVMEKEAVPVVGKVTVNAPSATTKPVAIPKGSVRDPKTGEVVAVANNYRFTKRWIKEALVTEGLLDKVYKNNELDTTAETVIKTALTAFAAMDKYRT
ncbi:MAG: hypothetical protein PHH59_12440 [Methylovulum sp.]|uniref:hypothetical protein n=1 Tax=Methylovulum sp. TaxID=1916980 RepID=UPI002634CF6E|nr:hypothetical protein [Methylovulum sp.]MDD2724816.1 hypothetical protein [Methylovulum sp.]MDD5124062.1 hypothetical protein [Methylovulum sp.]